MAARLRRDKEHEMALCTGARWDIHPHSAESFALFIKGCRLRGKKFGRDVIPDCVNERRCTRAYRAMRSKHHSIHSIQERFISIYREMGHVNTEQASFLASFCRLVLRVDTTPMNSVSAVDGLYCVEELLAPISE